MLRTNQHPPGPELVPVHERRALLRQLAYRQA